VVAYGITAARGSHGDRHGEKEGSESGRRAAHRGMAVSERKIRELAARVKAFVRAEINRGQIALGSGRCAAGRAATVSVPHAGEAARPDGHLQRYSEGGEMSKVEDGTERKDVPAREHPSARCSA